MLFAVVLLHDVAADLGVLPSSPPSWLLLAVGVILPYVTLGAVAFASGRVAERALLRLADGQDGDHPTFSPALYVGLALIVLDRRMALVRILALVHTGACVLGAGWLDAVRSLVGDLVLIDELIALAPALILLAVEYAARYPVERVVHDARMLSALDEGLPFYPTPSRWGYISMQVRHNLLLALLPLTLAFGWSETVTASLNWLAAWSESRLEAIVNTGAPLSLADRGAKEVAAVLGDPTAGTITDTVLRLGGVLALFVLLPVLLRRVWTTTPLADSPLRDKLENMCQHAKVGVADVLVWRTGGWMINGAVLGLVGKARYILLTDGLLDQLSEDHIRAVMAHEVGHVKRRHIPWLFAAMLAGSMTAAIIGQFAAIFVATFAGPVFGAWTQLLAAGASVGLGVAVFGYVSRRFEWQADAFAAQQLSLLNAEAGTAPPPVGPATVTLEAAGLMAGALLRVAALNHLDIYAFGFRHGSIARRIENLRALPGTVIGDAPADRASRRIKIALTATLAVVFVAIALLSFAAGPHTAAAAHPTASVVEWCLR